MEKKIEDYLHLYLGCECVGTGKKPGTKHYKLMGITVDGGYLWKTIPEGFTIDLGNDWKPILRNVSDMSDDECLHIAILAISPQSKALVRKWDIKRKPGCINIQIFYGIYPECLHISFGSDEERGFYMYCTNSDDSGVTYSVFNWDKIFPYLLSQHFDLFGLIDAGLALNKQSL